MAPSSAPTTGIGPLCRSEVGGPAIMARPARRTGPGSYSIRHGFLAPEVYAYMASASSEDQVLIAFSASPSGRLAFGRAGLLRFASRPCRLAGLPTLHRLFRGREIHRCPPSQRIPDAAGARSDEECPSRARRRGHPGGARSLRVSEFNSPPVHHFFPRQGGKSTLGLWEFPGFTARSWSAGMVAALDALRYGIRIRCGGLDVSCTAAIVVLHSAL